MKTHLFTLIAALLLLGGGFAACDEPNEKKIEIPEEPEEPQEPQGGTDISFTVYSVIGYDTDPRTALNWMNLDDVVGSLENNLHIIDSDEELKKYLSADYPPIDFSKKTLLLAYGHEPHLNTPQETIFQKISKQSYVMAVNLRASFAAAELDWRVAIVVDKLDEDCKVSLNVTRK